MDAYLLATKTSRCPWSRRRVPNSVLQYNVAGTPESDTHQMTTAPVLQAPIPSPSRHLSTTPVSSCGVVAAVRYSSTSDVQITHGISEHSGRDDRLASFLAAEGCVVHA